MSELSEMCREILFPLEKLQPSCEHTYCVDNYEGYGDIRSLVTAIFLV